MNINKNKKALFKLRSTVWFSALIFLLLSVSFQAQTTPEGAVALMKMGKLWAGVTANGGNATFEYRAGFFPNDYGILAQRGQYAEGWTAAGIRLATTNWYNPDPLVDSVEPASVYRMVNEYLPRGKVLEPMTNFIRYKYPEQVIDFENVDVTDMGEYNPDFVGFQNHTYDQSVHVKNEHLFGVTIDRKILSWSQTYHDNYIVSDVVFTNETDQTWENFYITFWEDTYNIYFSNGSNPAPSGNEEIRPEITWQHYHGGRPGDTLKTFAGGKVNGDLRVYYEYSADDPRTPGDDMGTPITSQGGRLIYPNMAFYTILHASKEPYTNPADDVDDFMQPRVTYTGKATQIPYNEANDQFGSSNFYAVRGGYSGDYSMDQFNSQFGNTFENTYHGLNTDELGTSDYTDYVAGYYGGSHEKTVSFGPYTFEPGEKIHIVWASGTAGIGYEKGQEIGRKWLNGTLQDPPNMPDPETGWLPSNFKFPAGATDMDKKKDRWLSMGIDSVMLAADRAKWNYDHNYNVPLAPPPPDRVEITGFGDGVEIKWTDPEAENMSTFAGYRIMRRVSALDTIYYEPIYDSGPGDKAAEHIYKDQTVLFGAKYYYYIQAKAKIGENDQNA